MPDDETADAPQASETPEAQASERPEGSAGVSPAEASEPMEQALPEPNPVHEELLARMQSAGFGGEAVLATDDAFGDLIVRVAAAQWRRAAEVAKEHLECDYLSFISGIDWQPAPREGDEAGGDTSAPVQPEEMTFGAAGSAGRFQVFAHVQSTTRHWAVTFKTDVDEANPVAESWVSVYPGADWHERECWEMFGIRFEGHPSLRHLYLPSEFEGHPLRKDFPLLARVVKPWPGLVDVEPMPGEDAEQVAADGQPEDSGSPSAASEAVEVSESS